MLKSEALQILDSKVAQCTRCQELTSLRKAHGWKTVPGTGNPETKVMVLGEAPGQNEAEQGEPFVGKAGQLLTSILKAAGWERQDVYITNILKCRPPGNRDPEQQEADNCRRFLDMQVRCIKPRWILCFGRIASIHLLGFGNETTIGSLRGRVHDYDGGIKVICTYHPSYLLRNPAAKSEVWKDLQPVISALHPKNCGV